MSTSNSHRYSDGQYEIDSIPDTYKYSSDELSLPVYFNRGLNEIRNSVANKKQLVEMEVKIMFYMVLYHLLSSTQAQQSGNVWDMLISDDSLNELQEPVSLPKAPFYGQPFPVASSSNVGLSLAGGGQIAPFASLKPKAEILRLIESFIRLQGEVGSRLYAVAVDNWDLIKYLVNTAINNIGYLQAFTVNGIIVTRKILEFASKMFASWQITVPNVNIDFSTLLKESDLFNDFS